MFLEMQSKDNFGESAMPISLTSNSAALIAHNNLSKTSTRATDSLSRLSSGNRINSAKDDASALSISNQLNLDLVTMQAASQNINQASAMMQIADGGLAEITEILNRMKTLISTAQSDQITDTERSYLNMEYQSLSQEIDRIADSTTFNDISLLNGTDQIDDEITTAAIGTNIGTAEGFVAYHFDENIVSATDAVTIEFDSTSGVFTATRLDSPGGAVLDTQSILLSDVGGVPSAGSTQVLNFSNVGLQVTLSSDFNDGADITANNELSLQTSSTVTGASLTFLVGVTSGTTITANIHGSDTTDLGMAGTNLSTRPNANAAAATFDLAFSSLSANRARVGAIMSRLEHAASSVMTSQQNLKGAHSVLSDTDVAKEMTEFTAANILQQAGVSMLAQANQMPQALLKLLG